MRTCSNGITSATKSLLVSLLTVACSSGMTGSGTVGRPAPGAATGPAPQPLVPRQFAEVAEADWTVDLPLVGRELECRNGKLRIFDCHDINLLSYLPETAVGGEELTALWGWTDPRTGREFVFAGHMDGTSFIEITDPLHPRYLGQLPRHEGAHRSHWRDVRVYRNHAFIVSDVAGPHGLQVFDLTQLRTVAAVPAVFQETAHYDRVGSVHTIEIDTASGFAYAVGSNGEGEVCGGGLHMIDIRTPTKPAFAGCYAETFGDSREPHRRPERSGRIHESQCVVYRGPDQWYRGRQLCLNAAYEALGIVDVTDKRHPKPISVGRYPNVGLTHQGWLTEDHRYFFLNDETDEQSLRYGQKMPADQIRPRTIVFDLQDLDDPVVAKEFLGTAPSTDHNLYIRGRYVYQSNYRAGLRVLDAHDPVNPKEVAYFDTTPLHENTPGTGAGSWSNYPYFKQSGVIAVSTFVPKQRDQPKTTRGLFLLRHRAVTASPPAPR